ncbi:MAG: response regulator [Bacteroidetes bacterium]|nr:response regulator [Bacteroidota bacterium]
MESVPKILIVDDKLENLIALRTVLKDLNIELVEATSGNEALKATLRHDFALALLDIQMPEMDGYELAEILRGEEKTADLPFIFISAVYTDNLNVFKGYEKGAFSFITKPFQPEILINKVRFFIEKHQQGITLHGLNLDLKKKNTELEAQAQKLRISEEELKTQQQRILQNNRDLEEKSQLLEEKNQAVNEKNEALEAATLELRKTAEELSQSNKYKSEFLANMSHELRTPLNSILLLSKLLAENEKENLTADQIKYANVIHDSGNGLLELINEILDLSKIESGKMELDIERVMLSDLSKNLTDLFAPLAKEKGILFSIKKSDALCESITTDVFRLEQVLKNFLSNALKFTERGSVELIMRSSTETESEKLNNQQSRIIAFEVKDTGIGVPNDKHELIFEAFQQADGSTKRKYGGTGLGLSISRKIARFLNGEIVLVSELGKGSSFTLLIPTE